MGLVKAIGHIGLREDSLTEVEFLVDTGSQYTMISPALARDLGITPTVNARAVLADSRTVDMGTAMAYLRLMDRDGAVPVGILEVPVPLLGVTSLEILGLKVNPVNQTLEHEWPFGPAVL